MPRTASSQPLNELMPTELAEMMQALDHEAVRMRGLAWRAFSASALGIADDAEALDAIIDSRRDEGGLMRNWTLTVSAAERLLSQLPDNEQVVLRVRYDEMRELSQQSDYDIWQAVELIGDLARALAVHEADAERTATGLAADAICHLNENADVWVDAIEAVYVSGRSSFCVELIAGLIAEFNPDFAGPLFDHWATCMRRTAFDGLTDGTTAAAIAAGAMPTALADTHGWSAVYRALGECAVAAADHLSAAGADRGDSMLSALSDLPMFRHLFH